MENLPPIILSPFLFAAFSAFAFFWLLWEAPLYSDWVGGSRCQMLWIISRTYLLAMRQWASDWKVCLRIFVCTMGARVFLLGYISHTIVVNTHAISSQPPSCQPWKFSYVLSAVYIFILYIITYMYLTFSLLYFLLSVYFFWLSFPKWAEIFWVSHMLSNFGLYLGCGTLWESESCLHSVENVDIFVGQG